MLGSVITVVPVLPVVVMPVLVILAVLAAWLAARSGTGFFRWTNASNRFRILQQRHVKVTVALEWVGNLHVTFMLCVGWRRNGERAHRIARADVRFEQKYHGGCRRAANTTSAERQPSFH